MMQSLYERSLFISDLHHPFQDPRAVKITLSFMRWFRPHVIHLVGDVVDFYAISRFNRNPARVLKLQEEIDETHDFLELLRKEAPRSQIVYFEGNHEDRLRKYLWSQATELSGLRNLTIESLLGLDKLAIRYVKTNDTYDFHGFQIEHGDIVRKHSGYTARGQMEKRGVSGLSGHTHRLGTHYLTNLGGDYVWLENGCLCDRKPEYIKAPNWQQGFSIGYYKRNNHRFSIEQVCITDGKAAFAGREFTP